MGRHNNGLWILIILIMALLAVALLRACVEEPVIPTPTKVNPTATAVIPTEKPTATAVIPTSTQIPPTAKSTSTVVIQTPTLTNVPTIYVEVYTGWKYGLDFYANGTLHFREGPGTAFYPLWKYGDNYTVIGGWLYEGTLLEFLYCASDTEWAVVVYEGMEGFVRAEYISPRLCSK